MSKILKALKNPKKIIQYLSRRGYLNWIDDQSYYKMTFRMNMGKKLDLENPKTFNEKLQWLKLNDRKPVYNKMVDKCDAKKYVADIIGEQYIIPTLGVWDRFEDINFDEFPNQFVLKCTHDSGGVVICKDKTTLDVEKAKNKLNKSLNKNYFWNGREWPYKDLKPRIIAEEYVENNEEGLHDYKIWCFNGEPTYVQYITGRIGNTTKEGFYDKEWNLQEFSFHNPIMKKPVPRPECLKELLELARKLSTNQPFVRCDFYVLEDGSIRFGEITFYPMSGLETFKPEEMDRKLGDMIDIQFRK